MTDPSVTERLREKEIAEIIKAYDKTDYTCGSARSEHDLSGMVTEAYKRGWQAASGELERKKEEIAGRFADKSRSYRRSAGHHQLRARGYSFP